MNPLDDSQDELLGGILPERPAQPVAPPPREFKPWHKPRKQWVRRHQWSAEIGPLIADTHFPEDGRVLRYFSLPAEDLLDVRSLRSTCLKHNVELRFTGMTSVKPGTPDDVALNLSENDVRALRGVHDGSRVYRERLESVAHPRSIAQRELTRNGPYHAINIDLCGHLARRPQSAGGGTYLDALASIIGFQLQHAMHSWLLFLTTRAVHREVDEGNLAALVQSIRTNVDSSGLFRDRVAALLQTEGERLMALLDAPNELQPAAFKDVFCLGFGKWLLAYISSATPPRKLAMRRSCYYSVYGGDPDMLSLVYRCDPIVRPPRDPSGILRPPQEAQERGEIPAALELVRETSSMTNLDEALANDPALREALISESETLLRAAHYAVDDPNRGYRAWLAADEP